MDLEDQLKKLEAEQKRLDAEWEAARAESNKPHGQQNASPEERTTEGRREGSEPQPSHAPGRPLQAIEEDISKNDKEIARVEGALQREAFREGVGEIAQPFVAAKDALIEAFSRDELKNDADRRADKEKSTEQVKLTVDAIPVLLDTMKIVTQLVTGQPELNSEQLLSQHHQPAAHVQQQRTEDRAEHHDPRHQAAPPATHDHHQTVHTPGQEHDHTVHAAAHGHDRAPAHVPAPEAEHKPTHDSHPSPNPEPRNKEDKERDEERNQGDDALRTVGDDGLWKKEPKPEREVPVANYTLKGGAEPQTPWHPDKQEAHADPAIAQKFEELRAKQAQEVDAQKERLEKQEQNFTEKHAGKPNEKALREAFDQQVAAMEANLAKKHEHQRETLFMPPRQLGI